MTPVREPYRGTLPSIIRNDAGLYEGDLVHYFQTVWRFAQNVNHPYHNFRHMLHVTVRCYEACLFYKERLNKREMRNLLIAALFHDFDHSGMMGNDDLNIERAIRGLHKHVLPQDTPDLFEIESIIWATEFPYKRPAEVYNLSCQIIRDADMSQSFTLAWLQQVVFGLAREWSKSPSEVLRGQETFTKNIRFHTEWGQEMYPQSTIDDKVAEILEYINLLELAPTTA